MQPSSCYILMFSLDNWYSTLIVIPWSTFCPSLPKYHDYEGVTDLFGEIYLVKKTTDKFFILANIGIKCQMDASEFEGLLYISLSEEPFKNQIFDMTDEKDDYTISYYVSHNFGIIIGETWTCLTCHATKPPKMLDDN